MLKSKLKVIKTGNYYEVFSYTDGFHYGYASKKSNGYNERDAPAQDSRKKASYRAKNNISRLILGNMDMYPQYRLVFLTLTFTENITSLEVANPLFNLFTKRLDYYCKKPIKYIAVPEFQERGAVHYHILIFNMPFIDKMVIEKDIWKLGGTTIKAVNRSKGLYNYITKYITKAFLDERCENKKRYFYSLDNHPEQVRDQTKATVIFSHLDDKDLIDKPYSYPVNDKNGQQVDEVVKFRYLVGVGGQTPPSEGG